MSNGIGWFVVFFVVLFFYVVFVMLRWVYG